MLLSFVKLSNAQDYVNYYHLVNKANVDKKNHNFNEALEFYEQAFSLVDYVHARAYENAAFCALKANDEEKAFVFIKAAISNGSDVDIKKFRRASFYKNLKQMAPSLKSSYENGLNREYVKAIDSLYYIDQRIIRNNRRVKGEYSIPENFGNMNKSKLDSAVFESLMSYVEKFGFPSEKTVGRQSYRKASAILLHNLRLSENSEFLEWAKKEVIKGNYSPFDYSFMIDQSLHIQNKPPYYYTIPLSIDGMDMDEINARRASIGLPDFDVKIAGKNFILHP